MNRHYFCGSRIGNCFQELPKRPTARARSPKACRAGHLWSAGTRFPVPDSYRGTGTDLDRIEAPKTRRLHPGRTGYDRDGSGFRGNPPNHESSRKKAGSSRASLLREKGLLLRPRPMTGGTR